MGSGINHYLLVVTFSSTNQLFLLIRIMQFYNNYCNVGSGSSFNYQTWARWAKQSSPNTRVAVGVLGAASGGDGYADPSTLKNVLQNVRYDSHFGGTCSLQRCLLFVGLTRSLNM
jgi:hypothetical protein